MTTLQTRVGRRGTSLLFFALLDIVYAVSLAVPPAEVRRTASLLYVGTVAPLWFWALLWAATGLICLAGAFIRHDRWAFTAAMGLKTLWGMVFLMGWLFFGLERGYVSTVVWCAFAGFVYVISTWPEPPALTVAEEVDRR